jgi:hypothetical protein
MIVKSILGFDAFAAPGAAGGHSSGGSVTVVLLVAIPFAAAAAFQFVNAWWVPAIRSPPAAPRPAARPPHAADLPGLSWDAAAAFH